MWRTTIYTPYASISTYARAHIYIHTYYMPHTGDHTHTHTLITYHMYAHRAAISLVCLSARASWSVPFLLDVSFRLHVYVRIRFMCMCKNIPDSGSWARWRLTIRVGTGNDDARVNFEYIIFLWISFLKRIIILQKVIKIF